MLEKKLQKVEKNYKNAYKAQQKNISVKSDKTCQQQKCRKRQPKSLKKNLKKRFNLKF